jgi:hypothetical protein
MGVLEVAARIVQLGGAPERAARVAEMRARFEGRTGAFAPENGWFEERSRAFWCDAVTRGRFGREVAAALTEEEREWLSPLERAHRGLFRAEGGILVDAWSGAELMVTLIDDECQTELASGVGQLFDARVVGADDRSGSDQSLVVALLPGAVFHPRDATASIEQVLAVAHERELSTDDVLDALLRMEHVLRSLSRVKPAYAYRTQALSSRSPDSPVRRAAKPLT